MDGPTGLIEAAITWLTAYSATLYALCLFGVTVATYRRGTREHVKTLWVLVAVWLVSVGYIQGTGDLTNWPLFAAVDLTCAAVLIRIAKRHFQLITAGLFAAMVAVHVAYGAATLVSGPDGGHLYQWVLTSLSYLTLLVQWLTTAPAWVRFVAENVAYSGNGLRWALASRGDGPGKVDGA